MASFDGWWGGEAGGGPAVTFVSFDRREVLALDLETTGWAQTMR
ncbi:MAG TPA: hypothetical protein VFS00_04630 [Polyangiaceae bacterium]|nr:hypothetical protein [Polyangiaceae bacterium]